MIKSSHWPRLFCEIFILSRLGYTIKIIILKVCQYSIVVLMDKKAVLLDYNILNPFF